MNGAAKSQSFARFIWPHLLPLTLISAIVAIGQVVFLQLWKAKLSVPFDYSEDTVVVAYFAKTLKEHAWYFINTHAGAPFFLTFFDFPQAEVLNFSILKLLFGLHLPVPLAINLFFLLTFYFIAWSSYLSCTMLRLSKYSSILVSVLFAFLPTHLFRGVHHLFVGNFFFVPLYLLVPLSIMSEESEAGFMPRLSARGLFLISVLSGTAGPYYACFFWISLFVSALFLFASDGTDRRRRFFRCLQAFGVSFAVLLLASATNLFGILKYGFNPLGFHRSPIEVEVNALKPLTLFLPVKDHLFPWFRKLTEYYWGLNPPFFGETRWTGLGVLGSIGLLFSLSVGLFRFQAKRLTSVNRIKLVTAAGILTIAFFLFATVGGFSSWLAFIVPSIRAVNRINVLIGFLALMCAGILLDRVYARVLPRFATLITASLMVVCLADLYSPALVPNYRNDQARFFSEKDFVTKIEQSLEGIRDPKVYQAPYIPFPEGGGLDSISDYDHLRLCLHSETIHWSYPAMKGRFGDWYAKTQAFSPTELVAELRRQGFSGIVLDRFGYVRNKPDTENQLAKILGPPVTEDQDKRRVFYRLRS